MTTAAPGPGAMGGRTLSACNVWSPHAPVINRKGLKLIPGPVACNRPEGHDGNHMHLLGSFEKLAEWGRCEVYK